MVWYSNLREINTHREQSVEASTEVITNSKLDTKILLNSDESDEKPCELAVEQNWRNKNDKKVKCTYLDACPGWDTFNIHKKHVIVSVLWQYFFNIKSKI